MSKSKIIVGLDEAGRGALAGPVVAGCCYFTTKDIPNFITDSKKLTAAKRLIAYNWLVENSRYSFGVSSNKIIDTKGILFATQKAMRVALAVMRAHISVDYVLVDGKDAFSFSVPHTSIIGGDLSEPLISAASIIAKVTRDSLVTKKHNRMPVYNLAKHKGYGTLEHRTALVKHGVSSYHRSSFIHFA